MRRIFLGMVTAAGLLLSFAGVEGTENYNAVGYSYAKGKVKRIYQVGVTEAEIKDIRFIVNTLGNVPMHKLPTYRKILRKTGDRVDHVHPLNFWKVIFSDKEMISSMHSISRRTLVWKQFMKEMGQSLQDEQDLNNLRQEFVEDFCAQLKVSLNDVKIQLANSNWKGFVRVLLQQIPREGEPDRYNL